MRVMVCFDIEVPDEIAQGAADGYMHVIAPVCQGVGEALKAQGPVVVQANAGRADMVTINVGGARERMHALLAHLDLEDVEILQ